MGACVSNALNPRFPLLQKGLTLTQAPLSRAKSYVTMWITHNRTEVFDQARNVITCVCPCMRTHTHSPPRVYQSNSGIENGLSPACCLLPSTMSCDVFNWISFQLASLAFLYNFILERMADVMNNSIISFWVLRNTKATFRLGVQPPFNLIKHLFNAYFVKGSKDDPEIWISEDSQVS